MTSKSLTVVLSMVAAGLIAVTMINCSPSSESDPLGLEAQNADTIATAGAQGPVDSGKKANVSLDTSRADLLQTSDTAWTLAKTGVVDEANSTVTWTITATKGAMVGGHLVVDGFLQVSNTGTGPATIGNIVVNLQTKVAGKWVTQSSDIADATNGDAATTAHVVSAASSEGKSLFTENAASGHLSLTVRKTNTVLSLVPEVSLPARTTVNAVFSATFDNNVLHLPSGTATRSEIIVTFGNHPAGGPNLTDTNVDINGNGVIDPDEAKVRSVSTRFQDTVPHTRDANTTVTITDALADITTTGTVTFSNPVFNLGATGGTVTVTYGAGTSGGSITNCAHATGTGITDAVGSFQYPIVPAFHADACDTQTIGAPCTPGAPGCGWKDGDVISYDSTLWGDETTALGALLDANFTNIYPDPTALVVGLPDPNFSITFSDAAAVLNYLPVNGNPAALDVDILDPTSTSSGIFGGDVTALKLNVDFADAGLIHGTSGLRFGDLRLCGLTVTALNGMTIRDFLDVVESLLSGAPPSTVSIADAETVLANVNSAFDAGAVSSFAQEHLVNGPCP